MEQEILLFVVCETWKILKPFKRVSDYRELFFDNFFSLVLKKITSGFLKKSWGTSRIFIELIAATLRNRSHFPFHPVLSSTVSVHLQIST